MGRYQVERQDYEPDGNRLVWTVFSTVEAEDSRDALLRFVSNDSAPERYATDYSPSGYEPGRYRVVDLGSGGFQMLREYDVSDLTRRKVDEAEPAVVEADAA